MHRWRRLAIVFAGVCASTGCRSVEGGSATAEPSAGFGVVTDVVDGDTVRIDFGDVVETVRLIGIDTPETVKPEAPVECYGPEASARTKELLPVGTDVRVERDTEPRDVYGRLLGYVTRRADGLFVNLSLVNDGFATPLTIEPNTAYRDRFVAAATDAESAGRGLWGACG